MMAVRSRKKRAVIRKDWDSMINPGPTPETVAKMRPDVVESLYRLGKIDSDQRWAAEKIQDVFEQVCRGLFPRAIDHRNPYVEKPSIRPAKGLELMRQSEFEHWRDVYKPWSAIEAKVLVGAGNPRTQLVHLVVVENMRLGEVEKYLEMRNSMAIIHLGEALRRYCRYSGRY